MRQRGLLLAFEGLDKTGKTTQCKLLRDHLQTLKVPVELLHFPVRQSSTGAVIDSYLRNKLDLSAQVSHLLFSANRWEFNSHMRERLAKGAVVILDRYIWSGRAYSYALGLDPEWANRSDEGLPLPDYIFYLRSQEKRNR
jgi:dTMP kinase